MTGAAMNRSPWFKRPWFLATALAILAGVVVLAISNSLRDFVGAAVGFSLYGATSAQDMDEAKALEVAVMPAITSIHHYAHSSALQRDRPPIFVDAGSGMILTQRPEVTVYEIRDRGEQDKVIAAMQTLVRDRKFKPFDLQFMDHENWVVRGNVGERGQELQLRRVRIAQNGVREEGGEKMITYRW